MIQLHTIPIVLPMLNKGQWSNQEISVLGALFDFGPGVEPLWFLSCCWRGLFVRTSRCPMSLIISLLVTTRILEKEFKTVWAGILLSRVHSQVYQSRSVDYWSEWVLYSFVFFFIDHIATPRLTKDVRKSFLRPILHNRISILFFLSNCCEIISDDLLLRKEAKSFCCFKTDE